MLSPKIKKYNIKTEVYNPIISQDNNYIIPEDCD